MRWSSTTFFCTLLSNLSTFCHSYAHAWLGHAPISRVDHHSRPNSTMTQTGMWTGSIMSVFHPFHCQIWNMFRRRKSWLCINPNLLQGSTLLDDIPSCWRILIVWSISSWSSFWRVTGFPISNIYPTTSLTWSVTGFQWFSWLI